MIIRIIKIVLEIIGTMALAISMLIVLGYYKDPLREVKPEVIHITNVEKKALM